MSGATRRSFVAGAGAVGAALLVGCEWPFEHFIFLNETSGPVHLFFGSIDKGVLAPGEGYSHPQRPVRLPDEGWWSQGINHEGQFIHAMKLGVTLVDERGRHRSFDTATLRAYMFRDPDDNFIFSIRPDLFEAP